MELRQLEYLVAVAEETSFTKAAAKLYVAQPGVSAQIRRLEGELGQPLLDRTGRAVRLTEAGEAVLPYARAALEAVAGARLAVEELTGLMRGHVTVGTVPSTAASELDLPGMLAGFHRDHPAVEISLAEGTSDELLEALRDGRVDLAFVGLASAPPAGIEIQVVVDEALVAAVSLDDPLAGRSSVALRTVAERALISLPRGSGLRRALDDAFAAQGLRPRIAFEASDPRVLADLARRGLGVAILPASGAASDPDLHALAFRPALRGLFVLAWRAEGPASPAARALIGRVREALA